MNSETGIFLCVLRKRREWMVENFQEHILCG